LAASIVRISIVALCAGAALSACGATENGPVIGVPQGAQVAASSASASDAIAAFENAMAARLNDAVTTQGTADGALVSQVNALASDGSLIASERMTALKTLGAQAVATRVALVQTLIHDAEADPLLAGTFVGGQGVRQTLVARLQAVEGQLQALGAKIAADSLGDVLRADVSSVATSSRVYGLVSPMTHLVLAAGDMLSTANTLDQQSQQIFAQITAGASGDPNYSTELKLYNQLTSSIRTTRSVAATAIVQVESLQPSSGSAASTTLSSQRLNLGALDAPSGALSNASNDIVQIRYLLGLRGH
jgi:hypothetical protein